MTPRTPAALALALLGQPLALPAQERPIRQADLPAAVARTAAIESRGATVRGLTREREDGKTYYEVELLVKGRSKDVLIDTTGTVVLVEEQVNLAELPEAVRTALEVGAGQGKIQLVESLTKRGKIVAYEAHVLTGKKRSEVQVGPDGKPLAHPE
jgi:hypothetical protein